MNILIIDDPSVCQMLSHILKLLYGECDITSVSDLTMAKQVLGESFAGRNNKFRLIITGLDRGNGDDGLRLMRYLKTVDPKKIKKTDVVLYCTAPTVETIADAKRLGALAVIEKGIDNFYDKIKALEIKS